jgi:hypothetical protein
LFLQLEFYRTQGGTLQIVRQEATQFAKEAKSDSLGDSSSLAEFKKSSSGIAFS